MTTGNEDIEVTVEDNISNAVGQGPAITIEVDGKEYELAPLKMKHLALVEKYAKKLRRTEALATIREAGDLLTPDQILEAVKELSAENDSWLDFLPTPAGIEYIVALRLSISYPAMSEEEIKDLITVEAISKVEAEMGELLGLDAFSAFGEEGDSSPNAESG